MKVTDFVPQFDDGVVEWLPAAPDKPAVQINPLYCLSVPSANLLRTILKENGIDVLAMVMLPPIPQSPASPFQFNRGVPWFVFAKREDSQENPGQTIILRNAGVLASYWRTPGVSGPVQIIEAVRQDVLMPVGV